MRAESRRNGHRLVVVPNQGGGDWYRYRICTAVGCTAEAAGRGWVLVQRPRTGDWAAQGAAWQGWDAMDNRRIADLFREVASRLEAQGASRFRVQAYRRGADVVADLTRPVAEILHAEGLEGLESLRWIGRSLARSIQLLVETGHLPLLDRLRGACRPERLLATVPTVGRKMAQRIHDELGVETLAELHAAAWDGRLDRLPGVGAKRLQAVRESLAGRYRTAGRDPAGGQDWTPPDIEPSVEELLDVVAEYRRLAAEDVLQRVAPRRFNPSGEAWLPILHTQRGPRHYTVMYSNTARAHGLGTTGDWVVIILDDDQLHGQWTVITSRFGRLRGQRIVRGREVECGRPTTVARQV